MNHPAQAPNPPPGETAGSARPSALTVHQCVVVSLAVLSLVIAWFIMADISRRDPWYRNTDMNMHNLVDALAINSGLAPNPFAQPAVPLKYLLALDYRVRHYLGTLPVWNMRKLAHSPDPLRELPRLIRIERVHSRMLVFTLILAAAGLVYTVTRKLDAACLATILLCGSAGLLFQGLLSRPELLCVGFGNVLALLCVWRATSGRSGMPAQVWLFAAGMCGGLATLEKLPGLGFLAACYGWCWLAAVIAAFERPDPSATSARPGYWSGLLPAAGAASVFWLLARLEGFHDALGPVVLWRLRMAAVLVGLLPLLTLGDMRSRTARFLLERVRELALLGSGALVTLALSYVLLRGVMPEPAAGKYLTGVLHFLVNPAPYLVSFLGSKEAVHGQFMASLRETPLLYGSTTLLVCAIVLVRKVAWRPKAFIALLLALGWGMAYLMSNRHFADQYSIFAQVPLLLVWAIGLQALASSWPAGQPAPRSHWAVPLAISVAFVLMFAVYLRVRNKYYYYQDDVSLPVNRLTLTFIFDHDAHHADYLKLMKTHYGNRENFAKILDQYLQDPANRH